MNNKLQEKKYAEAMDILEHIANAVALTITLTDTQETSLELVKQSLNAYEEFLNLTPEQRAVLEEQTDMALGELVAMNPEVEVIDNRPKKNKKTSTKKELLN